MAEFAYKTTGTQCGGAVLTEGGFKLDPPEQKEGCVRIPKVETTGGYASAQFKNSVENMLNSRSGYDGLDRHEVAHRAARVTGYTELEIYNVLIAVKDARADIAAERGEFHADSAHDACCYRKLKADFIAGT
jgi:hypothetical protein